MRRACVLDEASIAGVSEPIGRLSAQADAGGAGWVVVVGRPPGSGRGQRGEAGEGGGQVTGPGPGAGEAQDGLAGVEGEAPGGMQEAVAQALGFAARQSPSRHSVWA